MDEKVAIYDNIYGEIFVSTGAKVLAFGVDTVLQNAEYSGNEESTQPSTLIK